MDNLQAYLHVYARTFLVHPKLLQDGIILLSRMINLEISTQERIYFLENWVRRSSTSNATSSTSNATYLNSPHTVRDSCHDFVYLKVWDLQAEYEHETDSIAVTRDAKLYTGQTRDRRSRERNLQFYLRILQEPTFQFCVAHNLANQYHRDALEVATIAWIFYVFGLMQINRSPYAIYCYTQISEDVDVDSITNEHYTTQLGWTAWRYALLVGTAPPQTTINNPNYDVARMRDPNALMNLVDFPPRETGGLIRFLDNIGTEGWPRFLDHIVDIPCERMTDWNPQFTNQQIHENDASIVNRIQHQRASLAIMLGQRPTRLSADASPSQYMMTLCGKLTAKNLPNGKCVLLFWMIDPSIERRIVWHKQTFNSLLQMIPLVVNVIEKIFHQMGINFLPTLVGGISQDQAVLIIQWYDNSLLGRKVLYLVNKLRQEWNSNMSGEPPSIPDKLEPLFNTEDLDLDVPINDFTTEETDEDASRVAIMANIIISDGIATPVFRDKKFDTRIRRRCKERSPRFDFLSDVGRANEIAIECFTYGQEFRETVFRQRKRDGIFKPTRGETAEAQLKRCWRELWNQRISSSSHYASTKCTCTRCGMILDKVLQDNGHKLVLANGCPCQANSKEKVYHLSLGWQFVIGNFSKSFPRDNIFYLLYDKLPMEDCVLNAKQLMALLVRTIREYPENPQGMALSRRHGKGFDTILAFAKHKNWAQSHSQTGIMTGLRNAFQELPQSEHVVKIGYRPATSFEADYFQSGSVLRMMPLYAFGKACLWPTDSLYLLEDFDLYDYRATLRRLVEASRKRPHSP